MTEFFKVQTPGEARRLLGEHFLPSLRTERVLTAQALDRVLAEQLTSSQDLPEFARSTVDGYAVNAVDTYGASSGLPAFLTVIGEVPMGATSPLRVDAGEAVLIHTGGALPTGASAVVMVEDTQRIDATSIEVLKPVAEGENVIQIGEDIRRGDLLLTPGHLLRPQDIGGLLALGITQIEVARPPRVAIVSSGDEVVSPDQPTAPGQIRDINSYALAALVTKAGGHPILYGIVPDRRDILLSTMQKAHSEADIVVLSAGSSVSYRDLSVDVIEALGAPGVLVHGLSVKPGKPTILAVCDGVAVFGLPGNPVSAMVIFELVVTPAIHACLRTATPARTQVQARLARNVASSAGREDYVQVRIEERNGERWAVPVFGKSNLIYTLVHADGVIQIPLDSGGVREGAWVTVTMH